MSRNGCFRGSSRPRIRLRFSALGFLVDEQKALAIGGHVLRQRRALGSERHLPRWFNLENLGLRLGQRVERPVTTIGCASQVVHHDVVTRDGEDPRPRAFRKIGNADHCLPQCPTPCRERRGRGLRRQLDVAAHLVGDGDFLFLLLLDLILLIVP